MNRVRRGLLLPLLLGLGAGCLKSPPVTYPKAVKAPAIPMPPPLTENAWFGYLRAHQIVRFAERIGAGGLVAMAGSRGIDLRALDPEKPLIVAVGDPQGGGVDKLPIAALLPIAPGGSMAQMLSAIAGPEHATMYGGGVAFALNQPPIDATHGGTLIDALTGAPLVADIELYLHVAAMMARYGDQVHKGLADMQGELLKQDSTGRLDPELARTYVQWIEEAINKMHSFTIALGATDSAIEMSTISMDKGKGAPSLPAKAESMADLGQFVPAGDFRLEAGGKDLSRWFDMAVKIYQPAFKDDAASFARLKSLMAVFTQGRTQAAASFSFTGERLFTATMVMMVDDAESKFDSTRQMFELTKVPAFQKFYESQGFKVEASLTRDARQLEGWAVDHATYKMTPAEGNKAANDLKRFFDKALEADIMRIGSYLVYQFNGTPATFDKVVRDLLSGKGPNPTLSARANQPEGGFLYFDLDVPRMLGSIAQLLPEGERADMPRLDDSIPQVTMFGYDAGQVGYYRLLVPTRLVSAIRELAERGKRGGGGYLPQPKD